MSTITDRLLLIIEGNASGATGAFGKVGVAAKKAAADAESSSTAAGSALSKFGITAGAAATAGIAAAGVVIAKFAVDGIEKFADLTGQVRAFQRVTGASAEQSSQLVAAFNVLGVDADRAGTAIFRMAKNLDGQREALAKMGVQVAVNAAGNVDLTETFLNVADAVHAAGAGFKADEITAAAFGSRVGKDLLPVLLRGRDGLKELFDAAAQHHEIFSQADLEKGRQFNLATKELQQALVGLEVQAGQTLIPFITQLARASTKATEFSDKFHLGAYLFQPLVFLADHLGKASKGEKDLAAAALAAQKQLDAETEATKAQASALDGLVSATKGYRGSVDGITSANKALADARDEVTQKARDEADATDAARKANEDLTQAETDLIAAQNRAPDDLARSRRDYADATLKAEQADQDAYVAITKFGKGTLAAREALQAAADAHGDVADAAKKQADAEAAGARTKDVVDAEERVAAAKRAQADAAEAKTKADKEDPTADIAKAEQAVTDATLEELIARGKLNEAISTYNTEFQGTVTIADVLNGKADEFLTKLLDGSAALAKANADASALDARIQSANNAALGAGIVDANGTTLGPQDSTHANPAAPSPGSQFRNTGIGTGPVVVFNNTFNSVGASAADIVDEQAFLARSHGGFS